MQRFFVTDVFVWIFWIVFGVELFLSQSMTPSIETLITMGGLAPSLLVQSGEEYRLFAHMFLHGSFLHVIMNSIALHFGGRFLEMLVGRFWMAAIFLLSGFGAAHVAMAYSEPHIVLIGASGGVMGVLGAMVFCAWLLPRSPVRQMIIKNGYQIIIPSLVPLFSGVSYSAHLGGVLMGIILGFVVAFVLKFWHAR